MLYASCYVLYVIHDIYYAICYMLYAVCYMLYVKYTYLLYYKKSIGSCITMSQIKNNDIHYAVGNLIFQLSYFITLCSQ